MSSELSRRSFLLTHLPTVMRALTLALLWLVASPSVAAPATTLSTEPTVTTAATDSGDLKDAICIPFIGCI